MNAFLQHLNSATADVRHPAISSFLSATGADSAAEDRKGRQQGTAKTAKSRNSTSEHAGEGR